MNRAALGLVTALIQLSQAANAPAARADDYPARKPGLWETTMHMEKNQSNVVRYCIDAGTDAATRDMGQATMGSICSRHEFHRSGNVITTDDVCRIGNSQVTSHTVITFTGDTAYGTVITSQYDPPSYGGLATSSLTQEAKWLGPCGSDLQPGEMIVQGMKMRMPMAPKRVTP